MRSVLYLVACAALLMAAGCGKKTPYACVPVSGQVAYEDGSIIPADKVRVLFLSQAKPIDPKTTPKYGRAEADGNTGTFNFATTFAYRDGIIVGEHKVILQCITKGRLRLDLVPPQYGDKDKTPLRVRSSDSPLVIQVPKPGRLARVTNR